MIFQALAVGPFASNCFIVGSEKTREGMVIDPGAEARHILNHIKRLGLTIKLIVITHTHVDHIEAVREVKEATGAEIALHQDDAKDGSSGLARMLGISAPGSLPKPDRWLKDGDVLQVGELSFTVLHTPGHSPGSISVAGEGVVFTGDALFNYGIGRTDFPGASHAQLMSSIRNKLLTLPDDTEVFPGHGPETTIGEERHHNPWLR